MVTKTAWWLREDGEGEGGVRAGRGAGGRREGSTVEIEGEKGRGSRDGGAI
jgi:hypothetical protein